MKNQFHSNGKLLLTAEFLVIDGAKALALPCQYGQTLEILEEFEEPEIIWESYTDEGKKWFEGIFSIGEYGIQSIPYSAQKTDGEIAARMEQIFNALQELNPEKFKKGHVFKSKLEFPQMWGLGSSSTLLSNLAKWAKVNPYKLSNMTFGGSAYDIACARSKTPILYERIDPEAPRVSPVEFDPPFKKSLFFVHLGNKQNTREVVDHYKSIHPNIKKDWIKQASIFTEKFLECQDLNTFEVLMEAHEKLLSEVLQFPVTKEKEFSDFPGAIKSLGAWGGDFVLATGGFTAKQYFQSRGYTTIIDFADMVL